MIIYDEFPGLSSEEIASIRYVVSDVDDTITTEGLLLPEALSALYRIKASGRSTILLTGGSAGWADVYIRQWPVDAVIAESGAVMLLKEGKNIVYHTNPRIEGDESFNNRRKAFLERTGGYVLSSDQYCRLYDIAFDKNHLSEQMILKIKEIADNLHGQVFVSSIHANIALGDYSKGSAIIDFYSVLKSKLKITVSLEDFKRQTIAFGDSPNDQEMFRFFKNSIGNSNTIKNKEKFDFLPTISINKKGGIAFSEVVKKIF